MYCPSCKKELDINEFYFSKKNKRSSECKSCLKKRNKRYYLRNKELIIKKKKIYNKLHSERRNRQQKERRSKDNTKFRISERKYYLKKMKDPHFRISRNISREMGRSLQGKKHSKHWEEFVGYSRFQLKEHLEKKFKKGMNWKNYGSCWHIDHIIPKSLWEYNSYSDPEFKQCWSLANLQPMFAQENIRKGKRV